MTNPTPNVTYIGSGFYVKARPRWALHDQSMAPGQNAEQ